MDLQLVADERPTRNACQRITNHDNHDRQTSDDELEDGAVDIRGRPANKTTTGRWKACYLLMGFEVFERLAYLGIASNLITYLISVLHEESASSISSVYNWAGASWISTLLGGFIADTYWGSFWTIAVFAGVYLLGLLLLTLSVILPGLKPPMCPTSVNCKAASAGQMGIFYSSLYVITLGVGGVKPNISAFGAYQFDEEDSEEKVMKRSFFNWWWFSVNIGGLIAFTGLVYIEDHVGWGWGFGIPTVGFAIAMGLFFSGAPLYRFKRAGGSPLTSVAQVLVAAFRKSNVAVPCDPNMLYEVDQKGKRNLVHTNNLLFLDKAATPVAWNIDHRMGTADPTDESPKINPWRLCSVTQVEEVKLLSRVMPIWLSTLVFLILMAQISTFFLRQASTLDLSMGSSFKIPPASLEVTLTLTILIVIPIYDRFFVPLVRRFTGNERGISLLQRIGTGLVISIIGMVIAAVVERKRLMVIRDHGLLDNPGATIPMSVFWLVPQYSIFGLAQVFTYIGQVEFFYDQAPDGMQSIGTALFTSNIGVAYFLSTALLKVVVGASKRWGHQIWIIDNLNRCRLDNFYWLLSAMSAFNFCVFLLVARWYTYKKAERKFQSYSFNFKLDRVAPEHLIAV